MASSSSAISAKRCEENKEKIKIVPPTQVRALQNRQGGAGLLSPTEIGKHVLEGIARGVEATPAPGCDGGEDPLLDQLARDTADADAGATAVGSNGTGNQQ